MTLLRSSAPTVAISPVPLFRARGLVHSERDVLQGKIVPVIRGVYAPAEQWRELTPWDRYLARVHAVAIARPDAVFCGESAVALLGLPIIGDPGTVHVMKTAGTATARQIGQVRVHTQVESRTLIELNGLIVTSVPETIVDVARSRHPALGLAIADAGLRTSPDLSVESLVALNESRTNSRGRRHARWALHRASELAETPVESLSRAVIEWLGFPEPQLQHWFEEDRTDLWWKSQRIAGEADGDLKYSGRFGDPLEALRARRDRDARLFSNGVTAVPHWAWSDVVQFTRLRSILLSAGLRPERPEDTAPLLALRNLLSARSR